MRDANIVFCGEIYENMLFAVLCRSAEPASLGVCLGQGSVPVVSVRSEPSTAVHFPELWLSHAMGERGMKSTK